MKRIFILCLSAMMALGMMAQPPRHHEHNREYSREYSREHNHGHNRHARPVVCATPEQLSLTLQVTTTNFTMRFIKDKKEDENDI